jgi:hypothetical protein
MESHFNEVWNQQRLSLYAQDQKNKANFEAMLHNVMNHTDPDVRQLLVINCKLDKAMVLAMGDTKFPLRFLTDADRQQIWGGQSFDVVPGSKLSQVEKVVCKPATRDR